MKPKRITSITLNKMLKDLKKGDDSVVGSYIYKDYRIQISKYRQSTAQRVADLYKRRREAGLCILCGKKVRKKNPVTGRLYRLCDYHRKKVDQK